MTRQSGKYYTLEEARELVAWCKERHVTLIPEIDMPGHSAAFERAFGFGMQTPSGKEALHLILEEVCSVFDVPYIHLGTDEVNFSDPTFVPEMVAFVRSLGKKVSSWNPGWSYEPGEIDMVQLWSDRATPQAGIPAIDSRLHYINHFYPFADVAGLYTSTIAGQKEGSRDYAGSIIALWNDRPVGDERQILLQNSFYPAALALAARSWQGGGYQYFDDFGVCLPPDPAHPATADYLDFERRLFYHSRHTLPAEAPFGPRVPAQLWRISEAFDNEGDLSRSFEPEEALTLKDPYAFLSSLPASETYGPGVLLRHYWGPETVAAFLKDPRPDRTVYAWTRIWSDTEQESGLLFGTQDYSRSDRDKAPPQGRWDYRGSRLWLNGVEILPPEWKGDEGPVDWETPFGNENWTGRAAIPVTLRQGWNWLLVKLPVGDFSPSEVRLLKWGFYCGTTDEMD